MSRCSPAAEPLSSSSSRQLSDSSCMRLCLRVSTGEAKAGTGLERHSAGCSTLAEHRAAFLS